MIGHLGVNVGDLERAKQYYDRLMPLVDFEPFVSADDQFAYRPVGGKPGTFLFFYPAVDEAEYSRHRPGLQHLAFMVRTRAGVDAIHEWVQKEGNEVLHPPREWPEYPPPYYATFWTSPEGFMLEAVCHRSE